MSRNCNLCGAPASIDDRICFACQRPLVPVSPGTRKEIHPDIEQPPSRVDVALRAGNGDVSTLAVEFRWGHYREAVEIPREGMTIGSTIQADIVVPATFLQPTHARIGYDSKFWFIEALGAEACVLLKGEDIRRSSLEGIEVLRLGDRIGNVVNLRLLTPTVTVAAKAPGTSLRAVLPAPGSDLFIGQATACDIRLEHPLVRAQHARLWRDANGELFIEDKASVAGTYLNGDRLRSRSRLSEGDTLQIGPFSAKVGKGELVPLEQVAGIDIEVRDATLYAPGVITEPNVSQRALLREVSLHISPASLTAIAGPSGAGKTTLMRLLSGQVTSHEGLVAYNGEDINLCRRAHAPLMGFVPQDDIVHADLTVHEALDYQARLRLAPDVDSGLRDERVQRSLRFVGLLDQTNQLTKTLSGGQRKRVSIASELLNEPEVLFLDEPTSGLDPGLDKRMMLLLRLLADQGRTVVLTTHAIAHVDVCDTLVLVGPGGHVIYAGPPAEVTAWFEVESLGDVYSLIETREAAEKAAARLAPTIRVKQPHRLPAVKRPVGVEVAVGSRAWRQAIRHQAEIFGSRQIRLLSRDRTALTFSLLQGIAVALLTALIASKPLNWTQGGSAPIFVLGCAAAWFGMINSVRELVKEQTIWRREQIAGGLVPAYLASKVVVLAGLAAFQALSTVVALDATVGLPKGGPIDIPFLTFTLTLWLANLSGIGLGLLVSAVAPSSDRAMSIVPYLLIPQLVLSGVLFKLGGLSFVSWVIASHWSVSALGGIAGLSARALQETPGLYPHSAFGVILDWIVQILLSVAGIALCARVLRRQASRWSVG